MATVGSGDYRFELVPSWPDVPKYWDMGIISDGAVNSAGEVYVFARGTHPVTIWNASGGFISSWGEGDFKMAHGIHIGPDENVWLVDPHEHVVTRHSPGGEVLRTMGVRGVPKASFHGAPFNMPTGAAIAPSGDLFISDGYGGHRVHRFDSDGKLLRSWGKEGDGPGEFVNLHNIGVDKRGRVFICDRENNRVQLFDDNGEVLEIWSDVTAPNDLWIDDEVVYITEGDGLGGVTVWTLDGELITRWRGGDGALAGVEIGGHGIWLDREGGVYLGGSDVTKFQRL
jgi:hypothetical protein